MFSHLTCNGKLSSSMTDLNLPDLLQYLCSYNRLTTRQTAWPTHWLSDWLTDWVNDWLTSQQTEWPTHWLTDLLTVWINDWLISRHTEWPTHWLTDWLTERMADCLTDWLTKETWKTDCIEVTCDWQPSFPVEVAIPRVASCHVTGMRSRLDEQPDS